MSSTSESQSSQCTDKPDAERAESERGRSSTKRSDMLKAVFKFNDQGIFRVTNAVWKGKRLVVRLQQCRSRIESVLIVKEERKGSNEFEMLSSIRHSNTVKLFYGQQYEKFVLLHEEYLTRPRWRPELLSHVIPLTCGFMLDGIAALQELKSHGIIHRDISPGNVRWSRSGNCWKITVAERCAV
jgi:serine/threonine protein kinase